MEYLLIKCFHILAVVSWVGGLIFTSIVMSQRGGDAVILRSVFFRWVTPSMALAWVLGASMIVLAGWFPADWLSMKLVGVICLTALHGVVAGALLSDQYSHASLPYIQTATALLVLILVIMKPH